MSDIEELIARFRGVVDECLANSHMVNEGTLEAIRDEVVAALEQGHAILERVREARSNHPACDVHPDGDVVVCGWKRAVLDIDAALGVGQAA
ncbi:hypothetical protein [Microbacterium sp. KNMS]